MIRARVVLERAAQRSCVLQQGNGAMAKPTLNRKGARGVDTRLLSVPLVSCRCFPILPLVLCPDSTGRSERLKESVDNVRRAASWTQNGEKVERRPGGEHGAYPHTL